MHLLYAVVIAALCICFISIMLVVLEVYQREIAPNAKEENNHVQELYSFESDMVF
jgi:hypothetical protein